MKTKQLLALMGLVAVSCPTKEAQATESTDLPIVASYLEGERPLWTQPIEVKMTAPVDLWADLKVIDPTTNDYFEIQHRPRIKMTSDERYWLEKLIEAEAADEPYVGKIAVAISIANRVEDPSFPNTVMGVIQQRLPGRQSYQYSPWDDGSIYWRVASQESIDAVKLVFDEGFRNVPTDTIYFHDPRYSPSNWQSRTREYLFEIENHIFTSKYAKGTRTAALEELEAKQVSKEKE